MEILRGVAATLRLPGPEGDPVTFESTPKVTVTRDSDGSVLLDAVDAAEAEEVYSVVVPGTEILKPDILVATWTDGSSVYETRAEVVGGFLASLAEIKTKLDEKWPTADRVAAARETATRSIEQACNVAFRPRYDRATLQSSGTTRLLLPRPRLIEVLQITVDGEAVAIGDLTVDPVGVITSSTVWHGGSIEVAYLHGHEDFPAANLPVRDLAAHLLAKQPTDWNERATAVSNELGSYALVTPGMRGATFPLPSVNVFVQENSYPVIG